MQVEAINRHGAKFFLHVTGTKEKYLWGFHQFPNRNKAESTLVNKVLNTLKTNPEYEGWVFNILD